MGDATLTELLVAAARRSPDALAIKQWDRELSYAELMNRATELAARLDSAQAGELVGVCTGRTPDMVIGVVGTLLSGRGYVPLDPAYPPARLAGLAAQAHLTTAIADADGRAVLNGLSLVDIPASVPSRDWTPGPATPDSLAYVSFTSGSTGQPKGVKVSHRNVTQFLAACQELTGLGPHDRVLGLTSLAFDPVVMDIFLTLSTGASLRLMPHADRADPVRLNRFAQAHDVSFVATTPAVLSLLDPAEIPTLQTVITGGEVLTAEVARPWAKRRLINVYGPTETTVFVLAADLSDLDYEGDPPLGTPIGGHRAHVVDGELVIAGPGVALGYLDDPELTAQRFPPDPDHPGEKWYRTGDLVTREPDGTLRFLGRIDAQVKIRGQRVEPGEVEAVLRQHPGVRDVAVEPVPEANGTLSLVAFVVGEVSDVDLAALAREQLTEAMLPARYVHLTAMPIAVTGKVDREALHANASVPQLHELPSDPVAAAWARVLGQTPRPDDDFFALGGHSIAAMRLIVELRARLHRDLAVEDVFLGRTFAGLRQRIAEAPDSTGSEVTLGNPPTLSPSQRRLWFVDQLAPDSSAYNVVFCERILGDLDVAALRRAMQIVVDRHEVLRWRIVERDGLAHAVADPPSDVDVPLADLAPHELASALAALAAGRFDLATGPLWRAALFRLGPREHVLCLVFHHAVADGWSQAPLYADLAAAYAGQPLEPLAAGYADYATWRAARDAARAAEDEAWWREHLAGAPHVLDLPRDHHRPAVQTYSGASAHARLSERADAAVRSAAAECGATPSVVTLAAIGQALARWTGRDDNVIGAVLADRWRAEFHPLIGFFVDIVPLRLRAGSGSFAEHIRASLAELLAAQAHPGIALERIVDVAGVRRDPSRAPLVQVLFNVFNFAQPRLELSGLDSEPVPVAMPGSPFDMTFYLLERHGRLGFDVVYNPELYTESRVHRMLADLCALLEEMCSSPHRAASAAGPAFDSVGVVDPPRAEPTVHSGPTTDTEKMLMAVWREVLSRETVSASDNFFDLGGTSLAMTEVRSRLRERLHREVALVDLFRFPNIAALGSYLDGGVDDLSDSDLVRAAQRAALRRNRAGRRER